MEKLFEYLEQLYHVTQIPMCLVDENAQLIRGWPKANTDALNPSVAILLLMEFRLQKRNALNPMIHFFEPGLMVGIAEMDPNVFLFVGLVSPFVHTRQEILKMATSFVSPEHLNAFTELMMQQKPVFAEQIKGMLCLAEKLMGREVTKEQVFFLDYVYSRKMSDSILGELVFQQREESISHVPVDFEQAICNAVETGNRRMIEQTRSSHYQGKVGRMSFNELRQEKYAFICLATLSSRAAIRGGLDQETAFSLSDLYCQRCDLLMEIPQVHSLVFTMLCDFCDKVHEMQKIPSTTPLIQRCLTYITVHLHDSITLQELSDHVGLCTRSLSIRFRKEVGMGVPEYIHREKLKEADYLLKHTDYSLSDIYLFLNYPSQSYFTEIFKKYRGMTPKEYREKNI